MAKVVFPCLQFINQWFAPACIIHKQIVNGVIGNQGRKVALDATKIKKPEKANFSEQKVIQKDLTLSKDRLHLMLSPENTLPAFPVRNKCFNRGKFASANGPS